MNALKNILFFGLLLAVLCGVYLSLNRSPEPSMPPDFEASTKPPTVDIPGLDGGGSSLPPVTGRPDFSGPPNLPVQPPSMDPPSVAGGVAPPYRPGIESGLANMPPPVTPVPGSLPPPPSDNYSQHVDSLPPPPGTQPGVASDYPPGAHDPFGSRTAGSLSAGTVAGVVSNLPPPPDADHSRSVTLEHIMDQAEQKVREEKYADALRILSQVYGSPDVPQEQARKITEFLDKLAAKVIYSREHLLESPYLVQPGDTLETIAERYRVPPLLLARINGIRDPQNLPPGKELKVLKGPFTAQISVDRSELTMWLANCYAGRFSLALSGDLNQGSGIWKVQEKREPVAGGNGTGKQWIELGGDRGNISMQGTNDSSVATGRASRNSIWLSDQDMDDVFGILSVGSNVIIQR